MPSTRSALQRAALLVALVAITAAGLLAVPISAATSTVTGTITTAEGALLTPQAVAIVTIVDTTASPDAGVIIGEQRIDGPSQVPIDFAVAFDPATIDQTHAYVLLATITDGTSTWQNQVGEPVITGGPTSGLALTLAAVPSDPPATIEGTTVPPTGTVLSPEAVSIAALIKVETGTVVSRSVTPIKDPTKIGFAVGFDPGLTDPAATYVVKGGIVDGPTVWQNRDGVTAIQGGAPAANVSLPVTQATGTLPGYSAAPSTVPSGSSAAGGSIEPSASASSSASAAPSGSASVAPSAAPSSTVPSAPPSPSRQPSATPTPTPSAPPSPTPTPSATPSPTPTPSAPPTATPSPPPTESPTASPTATPTASPTPAPTPSPASPSPSASASSPASAAASASPSSSVAPSASAVAGPVTGTLTYKESHQLSGHAYAVVALVSGSARATESSIVTSEIYRDLAEKPVPFKLTFDSSAIDPAATYTVQAIIVDGENSWASAHGTPVLTKGNPSDADITLAYRPDLVKGTVTGQVAGLGMKPSAGAYSVAILIDRTSGETLGIDSTDAPKGLPVPFGVPFALNDVAPGSDYVVTAEVVNGSETWRNTEGVPVITNGNSRSGIQVVVAEVVAPSPSAAPTTSPTATPAPPAAPIAVDDSSGGGLLGIIILVALVGALAAFLIARGRSDTDAPPPADGESVAATETVENGGTPPATAPTDPTHPTA